MDELDTNAPHSMASHIGTSTTRVHRLRCAFDGIPRPADIAGSVRLMSGAFGWFVR